jgi:serine/threonine protein kinase
VDDPRLVRAVQEYLDAMEAGQRPQRQEFLHRYRDIAAPLAECLEALEFVHAVSPSLDGPAAGPSSPHPAPLAAADLAVPLGDFRILREIGRGGMGIVYEAEQLSLGRRIALKVLPFALTLDSRQLQRFKNEARAAAQLHHSNIVPIYSVGCERGVHFYAMQYIEGQTLAEVIAELRQLATPTAGPRATGDSQRTGPYVPSPSSTPPTASVTGTTGPRLAGTTDGSIRSPAFFRAAAQLGVQAAEALEHAHQIGVVHRDVKPANLLVDVRGHLFVTDFGLAQFKSDAALTMTGDLLGTLRYMSPEQALAKRGLVDHRTDVYSLGVTLYELLTLEPAFDGKDREELLRQIAFEEPRPPRRQNKAIPADLETILLKAMAKNPEERYTTAQEMADDLKRFLEQKPIHARRPTVLERAAKWSRRHRAVVASAVGVLLLAAVGFAVSTVLIAREQANTKAAYDRLAEEQKRTQAANEAKEQKSQQALRMLGVFAQVTDEELPDKPEVREVRRKLLLALREYCQDFIQQYPEDPSLAHWRVRLDELSSTTATDALAVLDPKRSSASSSSPSWLRSGGPLLLLEQPAVQEALAFSADQVAEVKLMGNMRRNVFRDLNLETWRNRVEELIALAAQEKAVVDRLNPEQTRRLKQIAWQESGASAFSDPELVEALQLTDTQVREIRRIQNGARGAMLRTGHRPGGLRPEDWKMAEELWRKARDQAMAVLTEEQQAAWDELVGEPFKGEIRLPYPSSYGLRPSPWPLKRP